MKTPRLWHGTVALDGQIYVLGGKDSGGYLSSIDCFDWGKNEWIRKGNLLEKRFSFIYH